MSSESTIEKADKTKVRAEDAEAADAADEREEDERDEDDDDDDGAARDEGDDDADDADVKVASKEKAATLLPKEKVVIDRPSSAKMIWTIMSRELAAYFTSPITYIVGCVLFSLFGLWFFFYKGGFWQIDRASMNRMFEAIPYALGLAIPLFTMRSLSDEKRVGTIELLITMPVKDSEVILGKYFAALSTVLLQIGLLVLYPIAMFKWPWHIGELDWNAYWVGMLGLVFLSAAATAIGVMWSSFTESQILSFFGTALTLAALYGLGFLTVVETLQGWPGDAIAFISLQTRFDSFARGVLDTRAVVYFLSITVFALLVAFRSLESRKWA
jgi:ABC-2 type transport system permease protein